MATMLSFAWSAHACSSNCSTTTCPTTITCCCAITSAGTSYALGADLNPGGGYSGISIPAGLGAVVINLNGFSILGSGSGNGISGSTATYVTVENGLISGMGGNGITLGTHATVKDVGSDYNTGTGIALSDYSSVEYSEAGYNGVGISCGLGCSTILRNVVDNNTTGISTGASDIVMENEVAYNATSTAFSSSTVWGLNVFDNNSAPACTIVGMGGSSQANNVCDGSYGPP